MEIAEIGGTARGYRRRDMPTAIEHDAVYVAMTLPAVMLFCPCHGGLRHNEAESITLEWDEAGMLVLADAVPAAAGGPTGGDAG
jgi:N-carbamoyl-L-amino-acid hydrolase